MLFLYLNCISRISWCGVFFSKQTLKIYVLSKYGGETQQLAGREQAMLCAHFETTRGKKHSHTADYYWPGKLNFIESEQFVNSYRQKHPEPNKPHIYEIDSP